MVKNAEKANYTVFDLFSLQVKKTPHKIAVQFNEKKLTFQELNYQANKYCSWLQNKNVVPGDVIGILLNPSIDFIVSIIAIIKAGGVYLPLDSSAPKKRLAEILKDAEPKIVITCEEFKSYLSKNDTNTTLIKEIYLKSAALSPKNPDIYLRPEEPIYMMYTSGSTGSPKGVIIPHKAVVNLVKIDNYAKVKTKDIVAQFSNIAFDASTFEIWSALLNGATLNIVPLKARQDYIKLTQFLETHKPTIIFLPTGFFHQIIKSVPRTLDAAKTIVFGGEQVNATLLKKFLLYRKNEKSPITLINGYGPTEATTFTCRHIINEQSTLNDEQLASIGSPISNSYVYILNEKNQLSNEGELCISGVNLAIGYHNCSLQNKEKFIDNPMMCTGDKNKFLYKSGDRVRQLSTGELLCLGRLDDQVKIGGFRIHLNEIEYQLMQHPDINLAAVKVELGKEQHQFLASYIISVSDKILSADNIRQFLGKSLPYYMIPSKYLLIKEMPLTPVGKIDKNKLAHCEHIDLSFHIDLSLTNTIEETIQAVWLHLLGRNMIDVNKNLFDLGANSLLITEACVKINDALQSELQVSHLLSYPTIYKLSKFLEGYVDEQGCNKAKNPIAVSINKTKKNGNIATEQSDIAIIGISCRFPKSNSLNEFWTNLCTGKECLTLFNADEIASMVHQSKVSHNGFVPVKGVLDDIEKFDANFFGFSPIDATITDPQQRVFLECAWEALENAGVAPSKVSSKTISVFAGMSDSSYLPENLVQNDWFCKEYDKFQQRIACSIGMLSTQVSYRFNLKGRSLNLNTACSTGLVTVAQACQDLLMGSSDIALAGAVSVFVPQIDGYVYKTGGIESQDGKCRPFSHDANGTVFSNGVGVVILKRLSDAIIDNDTIYAVIKGCGVNNDGSDKLGYTAPSTHGQIACIREALMQSTIKADEIGYIEAHGTATALGDVIEVGALASIYAEQTNKKQFCALGSVKGNIGHTDVAAGIAGFIKTVLCLYHQKIPPTLHFKKPNPNIALESTPFFVNEELINWKTHSRRYAGVSAFGVGGTNVHMILSEHTQELEAMQAESEQLFILSAKSENALKENTAKMIAYLRSLEKERATGSLASIAHTLQTGREDFAWRRIAIGKTSEEIIKNLQLSQTQLYSEHKPYNIVFMFPGQGMQYHFMAACLIKENPNFASLVTTGINIAQKYLNCNLLDILQNSSDDRLNQTQYAQPLLFIVEYALAKLLMSCGIIPTALIGHSIGEYVAACLSGVFSYEDGIALVCERGLLMASVSAGEMLSIECTVEEFRLYSQQLDFQRDANERSLELALHNSINHCVASGTSSAIKQLEKILEGQGRSYRKLKVSHPFHSKVMEEIELSFKDLLSRFSFSAPQIPIISNVTGGWLNTEDAINPDYWYRHLRYTVQMSKGFETLLSDKYSCFIEVGPGSSLNTFIKEIPHENIKKASIISAMPTTKTTELYKFLQTLGLLWQKGCHIDWDNFYKHHKRRHIAIPTYSFQKQRYWIDPNHLGLTAKKDPKIYKPVWSYQPIVMVDNIPSMKNTWIIFEDGAREPLPLLEFLKNKKIRPIIVSFGTEYTRKDSNHFIINVSSKDHYVKMFHAIKNTIHEPIVIHTCALYTLKPKLLLPEEIEDQLMLGFYSLLYITQAYMEQIGNQVTLKIAILTNGTQRILGNEDIFPINAGLVGANRAISLEYPCIKCKTFDFNLIEKPFSDKRLLNRIISICIDNDWENEQNLLAYRNGGEWSITHITENSNTRKTQRLKDNSVYLITGGLGGLALSISEAIAKTIFNPTFILLSRKAFPEESKWDKILQDKGNKNYITVGKLKLLKELKANLYIYQADISKFESLQLIVDHCHTTFGKIDGVIHSAGVAGDGIVQLKTHDMAQRVLKPKVHGTYNLARAFQNIPPDFFVFFSSIASLTGEIGQVDYCSANSCLDAFALTSLFSTAFIVSINWNTWREVGMAALIKRPVDIDYFDRGNDISPQQGQKMFLQAIQYNYSNVAISNYSIDDYTQKIISPIQSQKSSNLKAYTQKIFSKTLHNNEDKAKISTYSSVVKTARHHLNIMTSYTAPSNETERQLVKIWQDMLGVESIGVNDDFFALGGHSFKALGVIEKINKIFHCTLSVTQIYSNPTIKQLCTTINISALRHKTNICTPLKMIKKESPYIFLCHPVGGLIYCFNDFVMQSDLPLSTYGLQDPSVDANKMLYNSVLDMAKEYLHAIKQIQPHGPYYLVGYSFGGTIIYELAGLLKQQNEHVKLLALIDSWAIFSPLQYQENHFKSILHGLHKELPLALVDLAWQRMQLLLKHTPTKMNQEMILLKAMQLFEDYQSINDPVNGWSSYNSGKIICYPIQANHETIIDANNSRTIVRYIKDYCAFN